MAALNLRVTYNLKPGVRDAFVEALKASGVQQTIRAEDGCVGYDYYLSIEDDDMVVIIEEWDSKEQQQTHLAQPHMDIVRGLKEQFVESSTLEEF